jgi:predicted small metal-binding protein
MSGDTANPRSAEPMRLRCACGWETTGSEEELISAATEHGTRVHNMSPTREEVLDMIVQPHGPGSQARDG